jgi:Recombinase
VVRQVFAWVGGDRLTIGEVCRRLTPAGERTRTGTTVWDRRVGWGILKNPASQGAAVFGKTRLRPRLAQWEEQRQALAEAAALQGELRLIIGRLEDCATTLHDGLEAADWASKRDRIRALVKRVEVARNEVNVVFRLDPYPGDNAPKKKFATL